MVLAGQEVTSPRIVNTEREARDGNQEDRCSKRLHRRQGFLLMSSDALAVRLGKRLVAKMTENHEHMDKGLGHDEYLKFVGRNAQLREFRAWIAEEMKNLDVEEFEDDE